MEWVQLWKFRGTPYLELRLSLFSLTLFSLSCYVSQYQCSLTNLMLFLYPNDWSLYFILTILSLRSHTHKRLYTTCSWIECSILLDNLNPLEISNMSLKSYKFKVQYKAYPTLIYFKILTIFRLKSKCTYFIYFEYITRYKTNT